MILLDDQNSLPLILRPPFDVNGIVPDGLKFVCDETKNLLGPYILVEIPAGVYRIQYKSATRSDRADEIRYSLSFPWMLFKIHYGVVGDHYTTNGYAFMYYLNDSFDKCVRTAQNNLPNSNYHLCWHLPNVNCNGFEIFSRKCIENLKLSFIGGVFNNNRGLMMSHDYPSVTYIMKDGSFVIADGFRGWQEETTKDPHFSEKVDWLRTTGEVFLE